MSKINHSKKPHHVDRTPEVEELIAARYLAGESVISISRSLPIGDRLCYIVLKERGITRPPKVNKKGPEYAAKRKLYREANRARELAKKAKALSSEVQSRGDALRVSDVSSMVGDIPWSYGSE